MRGSATTPKVHVDDDPMPGPLDLQKLVQQYGVLEEALDACVKAAAAEFGCRIVVLRPAQFVIDGGRFEWPVSEPTNGKATAHSRSITRGA